MPRFLALLKPTPLLTSAQSGVFWFDNNVWIWSKLFGFYFDPMPENTIVKQERIKTSCNIFLAMKLVYNHYRSHTKTQRLGGYRMQRECLTWNMIFYCTPVLTMPFGLGRKALHVHVHTPVSSCNRHKRELPGEKLQSVFILTPIWRYKHPTPT